MGWWWWWGTWSERRPKASRESSSTDAEAMSLWKLLFYYGRKIGWKCITKCRLNFMIDVCSHLCCIASNFFSWWENTKWYANAEFYQNQQMRSFWYVFFLGKFQYLVASHRSILSKVCMTKILLVICILPELNICTRY